jgi:hypothetical protein
MRLNSFIAKTRSLNWSWILPVAALALTIYLMRQYPIEIANESLYLKVTCFNFLIPVLALWLLSARLTEPRVLLWASIPALIFRLPLIPIFSVYAFLFNRKNRAVRITGQCFLAIIAIISTAMFVFGMFWNSGAIYSGQSQIQVLERVRLGSFDIVLSSLDNMGALGGYTYNIDAEKPLGKWFKIVHPLASRYRSGYSDLKVVGPHTITVKMDSPDEKTKTLQTIQCNFQ